MDDEAARLVDTLLRSGAAWKATALQQSISIATIVLAAAIFRLRSGRSQKNQGLLLYLRGSTSSRVPVGLLRKRRVKSDFIHAKRSVFALW